VSTLYRINHLERLPLKTPYPAQVERIRAIKSRLPRQTELVIDFTGVGKGIFDMMVDAGLSPIGVTIHGGFEVHHAGSVVSVPKSVLVSTLVARLHAGELQVPQDLREWPALRRELLNFRPEITRSGNETWNARSGEHDDLVLATALAVWHLTGASTKYAGLLRWYAVEAGGGTASEQWAIGVDLGQSVDPTAIAVLSKSGQPDIAAAAPESAPEVLRARPYACFQAASGRRYTASEMGLIECSDPDDAADLRRAGCKVA
jgi:hypothetical protein